MTRTCSASSPSRAGELLAAAPAAWPLSVKSDVFSLLLLSVVVLWPIEIGVRRLNLSPRGLLTLGRAIVTFRRPKDLEVVVPPSISRLKQRIDTHRRGDPANPVEGPTPTVEPAETAAAPRQPQEPHHGPGR